MEKLKTKSEYDHQDFTAQFGDYVTATEEALPEIRKEAMRTLAQTIVVGIDLCGYKALKPKWLEKIPSMNDTEDPLDMIDLAGKITAKLTATHKQYNHYLYVFANVALNNYQREVAKREKLQTWRGFLLFKINSLIARGYKKC